MRCFLEKFTQLAQILHDRRRDKSQLYLFGKLQEQIHATTGPLKLIKLANDGQNVMRQNPKRINRPTHTLAGYAAHCMQRHVTRQEGLKSQKFLI